MLNLGTDLSSLEALDQEWDIACEVSLHDDLGSGAAEYVMWYSCCPLKGSPYILACPSCKDAKLATRVISCRDAATGEGCGAIFDPGSKAYRLIEPLNRKS